MVWCSHVLEHQRNVGTFLEKIYAALKDDGVLALTVPCHPRERFVGGHLTSWNAGLLCYNLVLAGFDCSEARILQTFELSLITQKKRAVLEEIERSTSSHVKDPLEKLARFFPFSAKTGGNAEILEANWGDRDYELPPAAYPGEIIVTSTHANLG